MRAALRWLPGMQLVTRCSRQTYVELGEDSRSAGADPEFPFRVDPVLSAAFARTGVLALPLSLGGGTRSGGMPRPAAASEDGPRVRVGLSSGASASPGRQSADRPDQREMQHGASDRFAPLRLEVREQLQRAGVVQSVMHPAQQHCAVGVVAAAHRPWRQVRAG